jgi:hypothetical protein
VKKGSLRPGFDVKDEIPANAFQAKIGSDTFLFLDLNNDEKLEPDVDGLSMPSVSSFVVPLPDKLLLKGGQFVPVFEETKSVQLTPDDLGAAKSTAADASVLTEIRLRIGLRPFTIDPKGTVDAEKHLDYMKANGLAVGGALSVSPHREVETNPGYSPEGDKAGRGGNIFRDRSDLKRAITSWYSTPFHGANLINPALRKVGPAVKHNVCILYFVDAGNYPNAPFCHPPEGATGIPTAFANGDDWEYPNPVPGHPDNGRGCGFPISLRTDGLSVDVLSATLADAGGKSVAGTFSSPTNPAHPTVTGNMRCAFFIPSKPLSPNTTYKATFKLAGDQPAVTSSFTTGK